MPAHITNETLPDLIAALIAYRSATAPASDRAETMTLEPDEQEVIRASRIARAKTALSRLGVEIHEPVKPCRPAGTPTVDADQVFPFPYSEAAT